MVSCKICSGSVSEGIPLSDGGMIHDSCLESIKGKELKIKNEIYDRRENITRLKGEIKKHEGLIFKVISLFSKPEISVVDLEKKIRIIEENIKQLTSSLASFQANSAKLYDYFLTYPPDWEERRRQVEERDSDQCCKCGNLRYLHLHHIKSLSEGGNNKISNLMLLCEKCHSKKHGGRDFSGEFNPSETAFSKRIANIRYAIANGKQITFGYRKPEEKRHKNRTIKPAEIINIDHHRDSGSTLCVSGYCYLRKAERIFALK